MIDNLHAEPAPRPRHIAGFPGERCPRQRLADSSLAAGFHGAGGRVAVLARLSEAAQVVEAAEWVDVFPALVAGFLYHPVDDGLVVIGVPVSVQRGHPRLPGDVPEAQL